MSRFKKTAASSGGNGGSFLKIDDNSSVNGVVRGPVVEFYMHWPAGGTKQVYDKPTAGAKPRYKVNFIVFEEGAFIAKVFEFPPTISNMLADIDESYDLDKIKIKISKFKQGERVSYQVMPLAGDKDKLSAKHLKEIDAVELHDLSIPEPSVAKELKNYAPSADGSDEVPF